MKRYIQSNTDSLPSKSFFIKSVETIYAGRILCVRYRKRTKDFALAWTNESFTNNSTLRFKTEEDAMQFLDDNPDLKRGYYAPAVLGKGRSLFELEEVNLDPEYVCNVPVYVDKRYIDEHVPKEDN